ncbi:MAG: hypothetical protein R3A44_15780 [Caldilineaceae bacterium]
MRRIGKLLRLRDGWLLLQRTFWLACALALLMQLAGRQWPIVHLAPFTILPFALWLTVVVAYTLLRRLTPMQIARRVDAELALKEQLATALELGQNGATEAIDAAPILIEKQRSQAVSVAQSIRADQFPLPVLRNPLLAAGALLVALFALWLRPNPMDQVLAARAAIAQAAQEQAARMETLRAAVAASTQLSSADKEELLRQLDELAQQLRANGGDRADALAEFSKLEEALRQKLDPAANARQQALDTLAAQLQALAQSQSDGEPPGDAAEALQQLAESLSTLTPDAQAELAQSLAQLANQLAQGGESDLAQALAALAQSVQQGMLPPRLALPKAQPHSLPKANLSCLPRPNCSRRWSKYNLPARLWRAKPWRNRARPNKVVAKLAKVARGRRDKVNKLDSKVKGSRARGSQTVNRRARGRTAARAPAKAVAVHKPIRRRPEPAAAAPIACRAPLAP